jgi:Uma2 family endonuclease
MALQELITPPTMSAQLEPRRFNVTEYYQMAEAGILSDDERVELIEGEVIKMGSIGSKHAACIARLSGLFHNRMSNQAIPWVQNPVRLSDFSEPVPDVCLVKRRSDFYAAHHPVPADVLLLIEVADSSLLKDRNVKVPLYAAAGIAEVWLVDLPAQSIEVYSNPSQGAYLNAQEFKRDELVTSATITDFSLPVNEILG